MSLKEAVDSPGESVTLSFCRETPEVSSWLCAVPQPWWVLVGKAGGSDKCYLGNGYLEWLLGSFVVFVWCPMCCQS